MAEEKNNNDSGNIQADSSGIQKELSKISISFNKTIIIIVISCAILIYIIFTFFFEKKNVIVQDVPPSVNTNVVKPVEDASVGAPAIPKLPEPPKLNVPSSPPLPPIVVPETPPVIQEPKSKEPDIPAVVSSASSSSIIESDQEKQRREAKRKSSIILLAGDLPKKTPEQEEQEATFKYRGDMSLVLVRGKLIDAVLETAINTDFGGEVRAVVSRDVFSEYGKNILIPKGSKIFGTYGTSSDAHGRISVIWDRIDLSNGYTIAFNSPTVDNLGRNGIQGRVDNKFKERFANSVLQSAFNIALAGALDKIVTPPINSQAAATNNAIATQLLNGSQTIMNDPLIKDDSTKIASICGNATATITDKTSAAYVLMKDACATAQSPTSGNNAHQRLATLMQAVNSAATSLLTTSNIAATPTQAQNASVQAFKDVTGTIKNMITEQVFKPSTTINQGTAIRIYVNKDYKFPRATLMKSRIVK